MAKLPTSAELKASDINDEVVLRKHEIVLNKTYTCNGYTVFRNHHSLEECVLPSGICREMGQPETITVSVVAGDTLNG